MRDAYRLTFLLPPVLLLKVASGKHRPCLHGCLLSVERGVVSIEGPSRDQVFEQARRFFRVEAKKIEAFTVAAVLHTPHCEGLGIPAGRDPYDIIVGSDVTFTAASIAPNISTPARERPQLTVISAG